MQVKVRAGSVAAVYAGCVRMRERQGRVVGRKPLHPTLHQPAKLLSCPPPHLPARPLILTCPSRPSALPSRCLLPAPCLLPLLPCSPSSAPLPRCCCRCCCHCCCCCCRGSLPSLLTACSPLPELYGRAAPLPPPCLSSCLLLSHISPSSEQRTLTTSLLGCSRTLVRSTGERGTTGQAHHSHTHTHAHARTHTGVNACPHSHAAEMPPT